jgi:hypothetical protein
MKTHLLIAAIPVVLMATAAQATLEVGTPATGSGTPTPRFGTLINFDDGTTGTDLASNRYVADGVTSIVNTLGPSLGFYSSSQSQPNYIGTGFGNNWNADILVSFATPQAAVGIGIAGPTTLKFELLAADMSVLESYSLSTTPINTYYYINRLTNDASFLRVAGDFVAIDDLQFDTKTVRPNVPEPATWAMMVCGFGLAGATMRRRRATVAFA